MLLTCSTCDAIIIGPVQLSAHEDEAPLCDSCKRKEAVSDLILSARIAMDILNHIEGDDQVNLAQGYLSDALVELEDVD